MGALPLMRLWQTRMACTFDTLEDIDGKEEDKEAQEAGHGTPLTVQIQAASIAAAEEG